MIKLLLRSIVYFSIIGCPLALKAEESLKRTIIILHLIDKDDRLEIIRLSKILETPLNHLGLIVEYHNSNQGLPDLTKRKDVRGILTWYDSGTKLKDPQEYVRWLDTQISQGRRVVVMEESGFFDPVVGWKNQNEETNKFLNKLGIQFTGERIIQATGMTIQAKDYRMVGLERQYGKTLPAFDVGQIINESAQSYLSVEKNGKTYSLITINENGAYVAEGYSFYSYEKNDQSYRAWYINPFEFFFIAFGLESFPIPDTTTLNGNRIYYSHIDGDGWNNVTQIEDYKGMNKLCSEVIYEQIFRKYPDFPVTVGIIGADVDSEWVGQEKSRLMAKRIYQLPHIEVASHTQSHPFSWDFFKALDHDNREKAYFPYYPKGYTWEATDKNLTFWKKITLLIKNLITPEARKKTPNELVIDGGYELPRGFAHKPFKLEDEILASCKLISALAPSGKKVELLLWSGDTNPPLKAFDLVNSLGIQNMNGGDTRFDWENYSYAWVAPKGKKAGDYWQIYTSTSNETIYTHTWKDRFYSYDSLLQTIKNTESPIRLNPFNIYYHIYIAEKIASLEALIQNLEYAKQQELTPIPASHYAKIVQGFYKTQIVKIASHQWSIENRGGLQTLRFDKAFLKGVDFTNSKGIIGQRHFQGSLYVFLERGERNPLLTLKKIELADNEIREDIPYVVQSNWQLEKVSSASDHLEFDAKGFGKGQMKWKVPNTGTYKLTVMQNKNPLYKTSLTVKADHNLIFSLPVSALELVQVIITREVQDA